jgi:hypothetical protein
MPYWYMGSSKGWLYRMTYVASAAMLAFVIDGEVVQVMGTDERLAAILLSDPIIIDVTGVDPALVTSANFDVTTNTFKDKA